MLKFFLGILFGGCLAAASFAVRPHTFMVVEGISPQMNTPIRYIVERQRAMGFAYGWKKQVGSNLTIRACHLNPHGVGVYDPNIAALPAPGQCLPVN